MTYADAHVLQRRVFQLNEQEGLSAAGVWYESRPLTTQVLNSYTLLIPDGERFIIRTCSRYLDRVAPGLQNELRNLFFQEGSHSREHKRVLAEMKKEGLSLDVFRKLVDWFSYRILEPFTPLKLRLATASAIEHHNAVIATHYLKQGLLKDVNRKELRRLFLWHFAEEIEHKETVYKLLECVSRSWLLRAAGLFVSFSTFLLYLALGAMLLSLKTGAVFRAAFWKEVFTTPEGSGHLVGALVKESWRYLRPGFRPSIEESRSLLASALVELDRMGEVVCEK